MQYLDGAHPQIAHKVGIGLFSCATEYQTTADLRRENSRREFDEPNISTELTPKLRMSNRLLTSRSSPPSSLSTSMLFRFRLDADVSLRACYLLACRRLALASRAAL